MPHRFQFLLTGWPVSKDAQIKVGDHPAWIIKFTNPGANAQGGHRWDGHGRKIS